jgi:biotin transporter BioY
VPGFIPAAWLCGLVAGSIASFFSALAASAFLAVLGFYFLALLAFSVFLGARERSAAVSLWLPLVYLTVHLGAGAGQLWEAVTGQSFPAEGKKNGRPLSSNADPATNAVQHDWSHAA